MNWRKTYEANVKTELHNNKWIQHLRIWRKDGKEICCKFDVLQQIKNDMLGEEIDAVEVFPSTNNLIDHVNYRHLYSIELDFGLHLTVSK